MTETDPNVDDVRREVRDAMARGSLSQSQVARQSGLSSPVVSQFLGGSYPGDNPAVAAKLRAWLDGLSAGEALRQTQLPPPGFVQTETAEAIMAALDRAQAETRLVAIIGTSGVGKTTSAQQFRSVRSNVWLVRMTPSVRTKFPMLQRIARALGTRAIGSGGDLEEGITARLRGTKGLLIADEAQYLDGGALETLRGLYDWAQIGVAVLGDHGLASTVDQLQQFARRISRRPVFRQPTAADLAAFAAAYGIVDTEQRAFLFDVAKAGGSLGSVEEVIRNANRAARTSGQPLAIDFLKLAWQELNLRGAA